VRHFAAPSYWSAYHSLPKAIQKTADRQYEILKSDPNHPSLQFKKIGRYRSVRIGLHYRALAVEIDEGLLWFWIGNHDEYDRLIKQQ
jgi:hypothetical protein